MATNLSGLPRTNRAPRMRDFEFQNQESSKQTTLYDQSQWGREIYSTERCWVSLEKKKYDLP